MTVTPQFLSLLRNWLTVHPLTVATHDRGLALAERHDFSLHDAMIVAAAIEAQCDTLWSEDMPDGMLVAGRLRVANPFAAAN